MDQQITRDITVNVDPGFWILELLGYPPRRLGYVPATDSNDWLNGAGMAVMREQGIVVQRRSTNRRCRMKAPLILVCPLLSRGRMVIDDE